MNHKASNGGGNGWDHDEPGAIVDAAVEAIQHEDPDAGRWADLAANLLTFGEGYGVITQSRLQDFLWYTLPRKSPPEDWVPIVDGTARLFDQLGLKRYTEITRSPTTDAVLAAWEADESDGFDRYQAAMDASGVQPPGTELLKWGGVMSSEELAAYESVALALETAIVDGELRPGSSGWRLKAASITDQTLTQRVRPMVGSDRKPQRRLDIVLGGRIDMWVSSAHPDPLREFRRIAAARIMDGPVPVEPQPPAADLTETAIAPMAWLLEACRDGVKATATGYLPPSLVREAAARFDWWSFDGQPRTEADVIQIVLLHEMATRNHWLQKRSGRIRTTRTGLALLDDPVVLWHAITAALGRQDAFAGAISELIAHRLLEGPAETQPLSESDELTQLLVTVLPAQGWQQGNTPIGVESLRHAVHEPLREWRLFGLLHEESPRYAGGRWVGRWMTSLTEVGRAAALAHLYARATEPRESLYD
jgi:hypothetical protein